MSKDDGDVGIPLTPENIEALGDAFARRFQAAFLDQLATGEAAMTEPSKEAWSGKKLRAEAQEYLAERHRLYNNARVPQQFRQMSRPYCDNDVIEAYEEGHDAGRALGRTEGVEQERDSIWLMVRDWRFTYPDAQRDLLDAILGKAPEPKPKTKTLDRQWTKL